MSQHWQGGQPGGYQYPMQTGVPPNFQQQQGFAGGLPPQPTGFPQQRPGGFQQPQTGFQQPQQTGFQQPQQAGFQQPQQAGFQHPQQTGFPGGGMPYQQPGFQGGGSGFQQRPPPPPPPVPQIPRQFQGQPQSQLQPTQANQGMLGGGLQQQRSFLSPSPGPGLVPQQTGFPGGLGGGGLVPQMTGFIDPRLQMMGSTFMPANLSAPYAPSGMPQFAGAPQQQQGLSLQQSFQQHNQAQRGSSPPKVPWSLSKAERKQYDQIFRAWDTSGTGFISGDTALQVFGQSGLEKNDMAKIWSLADQDDRGKLNLAEFHVAMGLIYRRLNGNDIPETLPPELVPPSSRDLDSSVDFVKGLLANDGHTRVTNGLDEPTSRLPVRSFNGSASDSANTRKDGTIYRHNEDEVSSYKSSNRHIDRRTVRTGNESPAADLNEMRRQLENTSKMLDKSAAESASRTAEDEALEKEMEDLRYRVRRVQDDLEYVSRGPRSFSKDEERRKLERDLLHLMNQRLPELERKIEERERRKEREKEDWARTRDHVNDKYSRFDDGYTSQDRFRDESDRRGYHRGTFDRDDHRSRSRGYDDDRDRGYDWRDKSRSRDKSRGRESPYGRGDDREPRPRSPPTSARSPPPPPPIVSAAKLQPAPPPAPTTSPAPNLKSMTPEERNAFIKADAQRLIQERKRLLGVATPSSSPTVDSSVEDRLASERKEAEEKVKQAEKEAEERERLRKERIESAKAFKDGTEKVTPAPVPSPAKAKTPAPPPPRRNAAPRPPPPRAAVTSSHVSVPSPPAPATSQVDPEEEKLRAREETLKKEREAREARLRELEKEEAEQRLAEEQYQARRQAFLNAKASASRPPAPAPPAPRSRVAPPPPAVRPVSPAPIAPSPLQVAAPSPPPAASPSKALTLPPPPPTSAAATSSPVVSPSAATPSPPTQSATNPFNKLMGQGGTPPVQSTSVGTNPFFRPQLPTTAPTPPPVKSTYTTAPTESDEEWDDLQEKEEDDSSDDEYNKSRATRDKLASKIFGGMMPSRGQSPATPGSSAPDATSSPPPAPPAPAAPPAPPAPAAPPAPLAPAAPPAPPAPVVPPAPPPPASAGGAASTAASENRGALFSQIQMGARLRKTVTNDRSTSAVSGNVLGDTAPPPHINAQPAPPSPPAPAALAPEPPTIATTDMSRNSSRQSVDWYAGLAADGSAPPQLPTTMEEEEEASPSVPVPDIHIDASAAAPVSEDIKDPMEDVDLGTTYRVRSLYPYDGQRVEDLSFSENLCINAHPSKTGGDWWYGTLKNGKSGFFPSTYVHELENVKAKALYTYTGGSSDELPFSEGEELTIVDRSEEDWWKTERDGVIFIVPAAYLEVNGEETPHKLPINTLDPKLNLSHLHPSLATQKQDSNDHSSSEVYASDNSDSESDPSEDGQSEEQRQLEYKARELERERVLAAAGLIVKHDGKSPPRMPTRTKSLRSHRPAPAAPERSLHAHHSSFDRDLPPIPTDEPTTPVESILHVDDAFDRYEAFKQHQVNRTSIASYDTAFSSPDVTTTAISPTASREENRSHGYSSLLNFLGRRTPGTEPEKRSNLSGLNISGPIISGPISKSPSREGSPGFGSSWASLVDKTALEGIPPEERRRQEAIFELISTENAYVRDLQLIVETFYRSMLPMLDQKETTVIFANIEDVLLTNTTFLSSLEDRQKECRLYIDSIGDLVESNMVRMGVYMQYCVNTGAAIKVLQSLRDSRPDLAAHLQRLRDDPSIRNLDLSSYLLTPMQRITRYPLLIRQIISQTHHQPERKQLEDSVSEVEQVLESINESIRDQEGQDRLRQISQGLWIDQGRLDLTEPTRFMGPRKLLKEGPLAKAKSSRKLHVFLCSDILVLTEETGRSLYRMPIPLSELQVRELPRRQELEFQIVLAYPRGGSVVNLRASSARDVQNWMRAIEQARNRCIAAEKRAARRSRGSLG